MKHILAFFIVSAIACSTFAANRNFCRVDGTNATAVVYAPDFIWPSWSTPTAADYLAQNWLYNRIASPTNREGCYAVLDKYEARGEAVYALYRYEPLPPVVRKWTPLSIKRSAFALGKWDALKEFLQTAGAYDDFIMAQYEAEDDPQFVLLMNAARAQFGDEWVNEVLDNAEVEP